MSTVLFFVKSLGSESSIPNSEANKFSVLSTFKTVDAGIILAKSYFYQLIVVYSHVKANLSVV